ncbi:MAG: serine/threonine protein kinase, partial [Ideonella sp.]|nr:serine/threonine protein kinase [Ideonella sp.]
MSDGRWFELDAAQWQRLRGWLDEAERLGDAERAAWLEALDDGCGGRLKGRLQAMLDADRTGAASSLQRLDAGPRLADAPGEGARAGMPGERRVGPYRLLHELGQGGMASVWLAERTDILQARQVALKLPHGVWHRAGLADRLAREREILATLEHPHIARLYDAGVSDDGAQPWIALEHVDGVRIDAYCRERVLPVHERLRLFLQVCDAVAHAHARLVVHRDLKPANILITRDGQAKLLDFGIAKLMEGQSSEPSDLTRQHGSAMTLEYAAPELLRGEVLGTAVDVFALGVVLFELLAGQRPYASRVAGASRREVERMILEDPAPRPSDVVADAALARALRGDLDVIVDKALRKLPAERYGTVAALADDVRRHLAHEPLFARPEGPWSRFRKLARRHRPVVAATVAATAALLIGSGLALWQAHAAGVQRDLALQAQAQAEEQARAARAAERLAAAESDLSSFLLSDLSSSSPERDLVRQLERATRMVKAQYRDEPSVRARMLVTLALNYRWISLHEEASRLFAEAEPLLREHGPPAALAHWECLQAVVKARAGDLAGARHQLERAFGILDAAGPAAAMTRGECAMEESLVLRLATESSRAADMAERALDEFRRAGRGEGEHASEALNAIARARGEAGDFGASVRAARDSVALLERTGRDETPGLRNAWGLVARSLRDGGQPLPALPAHGGHGRFDPAHPEMPTPVRLDYAETLIMLHRFGEAEQVLSSALAKARADRDDNQERFIL